METEKESLRTTEFVSRSVGARRPSYRLAKIDGGTRKKHNGSASAYLLVRLGICTLLFCAALALRLKGDDGTLEVISRMAYDRSPEETEEERLGRLKFVELPSIIDVFAPSREAILPVSFRDFYTEDEGRALVLTTNAGESVISPVSGSVTDIGEDEKLGRFVSISTENDLSFTLYGLDEITVERGQPVRQGNAIAATSGERMTVRSYSSGRPMELSRLFGLGKAG